MAAATSTNGSIVTRNIVNPEQTTTATNNNATISSDNGDNSNNIVNGSDTRGIFDSLVQGTHMHPAHLTTTTNNFSPIPFTNTTDLQHQRQLEWEKNDVELRQLENKKIELENKHLEQQHQQQYKKLQQQLPAAADAAPATVCV